MCCGKETYGQVEEGRGGFTRRQVLRAMGVGTGLVALGGLTGCTQFLGFDQAANNSDDEITALGTRNSELVLSVDGETLSVSPYSWKNQMHGFDLRFDSGKIKDRMDIRTAVRKGRGITYSRTKRDLFTMRFDIAPDQLPLLDEAAESILFNPLDLVETENMMQLYNELETRYPELIDAHRITVAWNSRQVRLIRAKSDKSAQQLTRLLEHAKDSPLFPLGEHLYQLVGQHKDFVAQAGLMFPGAGATTQSITAQDTESCARCGVGVAGFFGGTYGAAAACLVSGGAWCAFLLTMLFANEVFTALSCARCAGGGGTTQSDDPPPPPPPSGCSPGPCPEP